MTAITDSYKRPILTQQAKGEKEIKHTLWFFLYFIMYLYRFLKKKERHYKDTTERLLD